MLSLVLSLLIAEPLNRGFVSSADLMANCTSDFASDVARCFGYISAVHDTVRSYEEWEKIQEVCSPFKTSPAELRNAVVDYVRRHPETDSAQAASVVILALREKYPCAPAAGAGDKSR